MAFLEGGDVGDVERVVIVDVNIQPFAADDRRRAGHVQVSHIRVSSF
jgi:hypothetical protein